MSELAKEIRLETEDYTRLVEVADLKTEPEIDFKTDVDEEALIEFFGRPWFQ